MLTLVGWFGDHPPGDDAGFLAFAAQPRGARPLRRREGRRAASRRSRCTSSRRTAAATTSSCRPCPTAWSCSATRLQLQPGVRPGHDDQRARRGRRSTRCLARAPRARRRRPARRLLARVPAPARARDRLAVAARDHRGLPQPARAGRAARLDAAPRLVHRAGPRAHLARPLRGAPLPRGHAPGEARRPPSSTPTSCCARWRRCERLERSPAVDLAVAELAKTARRARRPLADPDPGRLERRVHADAAERRAAPGRARCSARSPTATAGAWHGPPQRSCKTSCGMAAAFLAMNRVYGELFVVGVAEAAEPEAAAARQARPARAARDRRAAPLRARRLRLGRHPRCSASTPSAGTRCSRAKGVTMQRYKFENFVKEVFLDSDTDVGLVSAAPVGRPGALDRHRNAQLAQARAIVNAIAGSRRMLVALGHPARPAGLARRDRPRARRAGSPTAGRATPSAIRSRRRSSRGASTTRSSSTPATSEDAKSGIRIVCIHKGLLPAGLRDARSRTGATPWSTTWARPRRTGRSSRS